VDLLLKVRETADNLIFAIDDLLNLFISVLQLLSESANDIGLKFVDALSELVKVGVHGLKVA
jgi:hypothetical protein